MCSGLSYILWEKCVSGCCVDLRLPGHLERVSLCSLFPDSWTLLVFITALPLLLFIITLWLIVLHFLLMLLAACGRLLILNFSI